MTTFTALRRAAVVATTVLAGLALAAPTARAESGTYADPADAGGSLTDIREVAVSHGTERVFVKVTFADLRAHSDAGPSGMRVYLDANPERRGPELVLVTGLQEGTDYQLVKVRRWKTVGEPLECEHRLALRPAQDVAKVRISRDCLGQPAEVRVAVRMDDLYDGSHPMTDWLKGPRAFTPWLQSS